MEIIRNNVKIEWADCGEGLRGDYDPDNPEDIALLRFDVYVKQDGEWIEPDDSSYCTNVPVDTPPKDLMKLLDILMDEIYEPASQGHRIKKLCERLSWISPEWIRKTERAKTIKSAMDKFDSLIQGIKS